MEKTRKAPPIKDVAKGLNKTVQSNIKIIIVLLLVSACLFVTSLALFLLMNLDTTKQSCEYNGTTYQIGESFPADDGCNTCFCSDDGQIGCTEIYCDTRAGN